MGPEVLGEAARILRVLDQTSSLRLEMDEWPLSADRYLETGIAITDDEFSRLEGEYQAILLGALGDPRVPGNEHARDILLGLRFRLDLYVNYRPCRVLLPAHSPLRAPEGGKMDLHIFRENTEGIYAGMGGTLRAGTRDEVAIEEDVNTWKGVDRIVRAAFRFAEIRGLTRITLVDKANAMTHAGGLWRRVFTEVAEAYPDLETEAMYVDAMAMDLIRRPDHHRVVVTSNLFGDILSDLAAALMGGIGLAPSANLHPGRHALFEPVHGSAPGIAGEGVANPMGAIFCVSLLLDHLGEEKLARHLEATIQDALREGVVTPDLGGTSDTVGVGRWIADRLAGNLAEDGPHA